MENFAWPRQKRHDRRSQRNGKCEQGPVKSGAGQGGPHRLGGVGGALFWAAGNRPPEIKDKSRPPGGTDVAWTSSSVEVSVTEAEKGRGQAEESKVRQTEPACCKDIL